MARRLSPIDYSLLEKLSVASRIPCYTVCSYLTCTPLLGLEEAIYLPLNYRMFLNLGGQHIRARPMQEPGSAIRYAVYRSTLAH